MRNSVKLLPVLLLGSALGGCSMAGTGDYFADEYAPMQQTQMPQYWGAPSAPACEYTGCEVSYPSAPSHVATHPYGGQPASVPAPQAYGQSVQAHHMNYGHQGHQGSHGDHGHQAHHQNGHAPAYVNSHGKKRKGLRQAYTYGSLGATMYDVDSELFGVQGRLGWQSKSFFGAEVEGSVGISDDDATVIVAGVPLNATTGVDTQLAAFGVARYPVSDRINVLGRVGYHRTEFTGDVSDGTTTADLDFSTDGIAYGLGAEYALGRKTSVRADYTRYDLDGATADAVSLAIARKF